MWRAVTTTIAMLVLLLTKVRGTFTTPEQQPWDVLCPRTYLEQCECVVRWSDFMDRPVKTVTCSGPLNATSFMLPNGTESIQLENVAGLKSEMFQSERQLLIFQVSGLVSDTLPADLLLGMDKLKFLSLRFNLKLKSLHKGFFGNLRNLDRIEISVTGLRMLSVDTFANLTALSFLDLSRNSLENLQVGLFDDLSALAFLDLHGNNISSLPPMIFRHLSALSELNLQNNAISDVSPSALDGLQSLLKLDLSRNEIHTIPTGALLQLKKLSFLDVAYNPVVTVVEETFMGPTSLTDLGLDDRQLDMWDPEVLSELASLRWLYIDSVQYDWDQLMYEGGQWWFSCPPKTCVFGDCSITQHHPNCTCRQGFSGDACDTPTDEEGEVRTRVVVIGVTATVVVMVVTVFGCDRFWRTRKLRYQNV